LDKLGRRLKKLLGITAKIETALSGVVEKSRFSAGIFNFKWKLRKKL
jgi:hypothetical protein